MLLGKGRAVCGSCRHILFWTKRNVSSSASPSSPGQPADTYPGKASAASASASKERASFAERRELSVVEADHDAFAAEFEDAFYGVDKLGVPSLRPAAQVTVQADSFGKSQQKSTDQSARRSGKPRFNVKGLKTDEPLYQPSLWQQLLEQERNRRENERARLTRASFKRMKEQATAASSQEPAPSQLLKSRAVGNDSSDSRSVECRQSALEESASSFKSQTEDPTDSRKFLESLESFEDLQREWRSESAIRDVGRRDEGEASRRTESLSVSDDLFQKKLGEASFLGESPLMEESCGISVSTEEAELVTPSAPTVVASHFAGMHSSLWRRLTPHHLQTQQRLVRSSSSEQVLDAVAAAFEAVNGGEFRASRTRRSEETDEKDEESEGASAVAQRFGLDPINAVTAIHRLGRLATPFQRQEILQDGRFLKLMEATEASLSLLDSQGASNLFWGVTRLELSPTWKRQLLQRCVSLTPAMTPHQLATCLFCLSRMALPFAEAKSLENALVEAVEKRVPAINRPLDLTCVCASLAKLRVRHPGLFSALSSRALQLLPELSMAELASIGWALAASGNKDPAFFGAAARRVEKEVDLCSSGDVVQLAWAFVRTGHFTEDLFALTLSPVVRSFMPDFNARQLATLAATYAKADVFDQDLLSDLAVSAVPRVSELTPQDAASLSVAMAHLRLRNRELVSALSRHCIQTIDSFSGPQLARVIYGLGSTGAAGSSFLHRLCDALTKRAVSLFPDQITQALVGMSEAEYMEHPVVPQLLKLVEKRVDGLFAEDCIHLLRVASKLDARLLQRSLIPLLQKQLRSKLRVFWCIDADNIGDLLHALVMLRQPDPHFLHLLMRRLAFIIQQSSSRQFLRLLGCLAALTDGERLLVQTHLQRRPKLQAAFHSQLSVLASMSLDGDSIAALLFSAAHLGFADESLSQCVRPSSQGVNASSCKVNMQCSWVRSALIYFLTRRYGVQNDTPRDTKGEPRERNEASLFERNRTLSLAERREFCKKLHLGEYRGGEVMTSVRSRQEDAASVDSEEGNLSSTLFESKEKLAIAESLLKAAFVCVCLGEESFLLPLMEEVAKWIANGKKANSALEALLAWTVSAASLSLFGERLPSDLLRAQQVCFHVTRMHARPRKESPSFRTLERWSKFVLEAPRYDVYYQGKAANKFGAEGARLRVKDYNFDAWISETLVKMRIPHKRTFVLAGIYRVSAAFPLDKHLIDVLTFQDLIAPSGTPTATAVLRQRHLASLGWTVHSVHLRALYTAVLDRNLGAFIAQIASTCSPAAAEWVNFRREDAATDPAPEKGVSVQSILESDLEKLPSLQRGGFSPFELKDDLQVGRKQREARGPGEDWKSMEEETVDDAVEEDARASLEAAAALEDAYSSVMRS